RPVGARGGRRPHAGTRRGRAPDDRPPHEEHREGRGGQGILRVGLTGGIACGKSYVLRRLAAAGLETLDLDAVAHDVITPGGAAYADVVAAFGPAILTPDGAVDRARLAELVFS